jgi:two-component system LytT family response regulator
MPVTVVVSETEKHLWSVLNCFLKAEPGFEVLDGPWADPLNEITLEQFRPDAVFLDLENAFANDIIGNLKQLETPPKLVAFASNMSAASVAFEIGAVDFLAKPPSQRDLNRAVARIRDEVELMRAAEVGRRVLSAFPHLQEKPIYMSRLTLKSKRKIVFVDVNQIVWVSSEGNYMNVYTRGEAHFIRNTMEDLEQKLDPSQFIRVHKRSLVNLRMIQEIRPWGKKLLFF